MPTIEEYIWYEKYRPHTVADMTLPPQYRAKFMEYVAKGEIPHLLFSGPPGSGKTTLAFVLMDSIPSVRLVLNASSNDRGIDTMKGKVRQFAASQAPDGKLKIVFLDEADQLTKEAMGALRNTIETYSKTCRFIFTCNEVDAIMPAIKSRPQHFIFSAFPVPQVVDLAKSILKAEAVDYSDEDLIKIVNTHYPDIRSIVNNLQMCTIDGRLDIRVIAGASVNPDMVLDTIVAGEIGKLRVLLSGVASFTSLYRFLFDTMLAAEDLDQPAKMEIAGILSEHLYRDATIANREINFVACCVSLMSVLKVGQITF